MSHSGHLSNSQLLENPCSIKGREEGRSPTPPLFTMWGTSIQLKPKNTLKNIEFNEKMINLMNNSYITALYRKNYPLKTLNSLMRCGEREGEFIESCKNNCNKSEPVLIKMFHKCENRLCDICYPRLKIKNYKKFYPFLWGNREKGKNLSFLTISPLNFDNLREGIAYVKKAFTNFRRNKYWKSHVSGGLYTLEIKRVRKGQEIKDRRTGKFLYYAEKDSWNIHIHCLIFAVTMSNKLRGKCLDCGYNFLKQEKESGKYYCHNQNCNSFNVVDVQESKLQEEWKKSAQGRPAVLDIVALKRNKDNLKKSLNYLLKYISITKDNVTEPEDLAELMLVLKDMKLINKFGNLYKKKIPKRPKKCCKHCGGDLSRNFDKHDCLIYHAEIDKEFIKECNSGGKIKKKNELPLIIEYQKL